MLSQLYFFLNQVLPTSIHNKQMSTVLVTYVLLKSIIMMILCSVYNVIRTEVLCFQSMIFIKQNSLGFADY
jgi:hypothetical protein